MGIYFTRLLRRSIVDTYEYSIGTAWSLNRRETVWEHAILSSNRGNERRSDADREHQRRPDRLPRRGPRPIAPARPRLPAQQRDVGATDHRALGRLPADRPRLARLRRQLGRA